MNQDKTVSRQWRTRPRDERFLSLEALHEHVTRRAERSRAFVDALGSMRMVAQDDDLRVIVADQSLALTEWSFSQICTSVRVTGNSLSTTLPRDFLRALPAARAAEVANYVLARQSGNAMYYVTDDTLRAVTSPRYGRITDAAVTEAIMRATKGGKWRVPGVSAAGPRGYDPNAPVTLDNTTIYGSDRDIFVFLADPDPIVIGTTAGGQPDILYRGFYVRNSEVGASTYELCTMYFRAVCQNRIIWGVEGRNVVRIRHNANAWERFIDEAITHLDDICLDNGEIVAGVNRAKEKILAATDDDVVMRFKAIGLGEEAAHIAMLAYQNLEDRKVRTAWDFSQAASMLGHLHDHADQRLAVEKTASRFLD